MISLDSYSFTFTTGFFGATAGFFGFKLALNMNAFIVCSSLASFLFSSYHKLRQPHHLDRPKFLRHYLYSQNPRHQQ